jgi:hypothetical protein
VQRELKTQDCTQNLEENGPVNTPDVEVEAELEVEDIMLEIVDPEPPALEPPALEIEIEMGIEIPEVPDEQPEHCVENNFDNLFKQTSMIHDIRNSSYNWINLSNITGRQDSNEPHSPNPAPTQSPQRLNTFKSPIKIPQPRTHDSTTPTPNPNQPQSH